jgi:serine/threonine-protein kinase Chk2
MQRQSLTPFTQVMETTNGVHGSAPPLQLPRAIAEDIFNGSTQGISQTQVMESDLNPNHPIIEVNGVLARIIDLQTGQVVEFLSDMMEITLGRSPQSTIVIRDPNVSSKHLRIFRDDHSFALVDSSVNGTFVNGIPLTKLDMRRLQSGDEFSLVLNSYRPADKARHMYMFVEPPVGGDPSSVLTHYHLGRCIGKGNFSEVHIGVNRSTGERVAVKVVDTLKTEQFSKKSRSVALNIDSEMEVLRTLNHPNIIKFYGMYRSPANVHLVLEYADGGDLLNRILEKGCYNEEDGRVVFSQICAGVAYLHSRDICHRDLKPDNVLLTANGTAKISDFGLARHASSQSENNFRTYCGTPHYFAPEMFKLQKQQVDGYGKAVDVWSLGVILYIIVSGKPPFDDENLGEQVVNGTFEFDGPEFECVSDDAKDLISRLMTVDPKLRLTCDEALRHVWLSGIPGLGPGAPPKSHGMERIDEGQLSPSGDNVMMMD